MQDRLATLFYNTAYAVCFAGTSLAWSFRFEGGRHMPRRGPALVLANHESLLDPVLVGVSSPRRLRSLARKTLFRNPAFAWLIRSLGAAPVDQEGVAKEGLKAVLRELEQGQAVLIFPEGERTLPGRMQALKPGIHLILRRAPVPIVPVGVAGAFEALPRSRLVPQFAPLFLPATSATTAVSIGAPLDGRRFAEMPRVQCLNEM